MKRNPIFYCSIAILALVSVMAAQAQSTCALDGTFTLNNGEFVVQNNVWGATTPQCISAVGNSGFTVTSSGANQGSVAAYPSIYKGCHWGECSSNSGMPILVSNITSANYSWSTGGPVSGTWNISAEAWLSPSTNSTSGYNGGAELMMWLDYRGMQPSGSQVGTVNIGGATWEVWYSKLQWNYIAYRRSGASSFSGDLLDFIKDSISRGYIQSSWYLHDLEAGFEIMSGGAGFTVNNFSFTLNTGSVTPAPTAASTPAPTVAPTSPPSNLGDVNGNGSVDIVDALLVAQYYVGLDPANFNAANADVTRDGNIDIIDALRIAQCYVGIASCNF
jgi:hypothetical protein